MHRALIATNRRLYCLRYTRRLVNNWRKSLGLSEPLSKSVGSKLLAPIHYIPLDKFTPSGKVLADLKWLMQKVKLKQDIFLIGPPSRYRSQLVAMMLELLNLEFEYIMLNRDTSESDLKQRKELQTTAMSSIYVDQCVVRAATNGRILILDGVEKAERNLLPIINNLVENREMQLEDGRFMIPENRYEMLFKSGNSSNSLVPVHGDFRVICIGLPTPPFRGHNLDPPFRSRFQSRKITHWPLKEQFLIANATAPSVDSDILSRWISFSNAMISDDIQHKSSQMEAIGEESNTTLSEKKKVLAGPPPYFPVDLCLVASKLLENCPNINGKEMIEFVYPFGLLEEMTPGCSELVKRMAHKFNFWEERRKDGVSSIISSISLEPIASKNEAKISFALPSTNSEFVVPCGDGICGPLTGDATHFVETDGTRKTFINMLLAHSVGDFCLVGARGSGKTANIMRFAKALGYSDEITTVMVFQDMTGRDLLQQRITKSDGSTGWQFSPVIQSALSGGLLVLDGIHVLNTSTMMVLKRLVEDREVFLPDGSRGLRHDRFDELKALNEMPDKQMNSAGIYRIHPGFRIIAVGEPPTASKSISMQTGGKKSSALISAPGPWLTPDVNGMFLFVNLPPPSQTEELKILTSVSPNMKSVAEKLVRLSQNDASLLSLRQKLRILRLLQEYPQVSLYDAVTSASLHRFMSLPARTALSDSLSKSGIKREHSVLNASTPQISIEGNNLTVGDVTTQIYAAGEVEGHSSVDNIDDAMRIPSVLFYDNSRQLVSMSSMLKSLLLGEHLLVIGNQGVGKNRIVDRLLELWQRPRHYAQLHRDSTVQSLTVTPSVTGGKLHFEDSPLLKAVRAGHILVLDEADKAPVHVTRVLKGLVESGHMLLPDGRRISNRLTGKDVIPLHPEFRMIVLANPPGYPFLGNNFFASLGDLFSCHIVENPDFESEMELVRNYAGDNFDQDLLSRLTASFAELRSKADEGLLPYPYSTRELINVVKHLATFPNDSVNDALKNVFDFDTWNESALDAATSAFGKFGIRTDHADKKQFSQKLAPVLELPNAVKVGQLKHVSNTESPPIELVSSDTLQLDRREQIDIHRIAVDQLDGRLSTFSELTRAFQLDLPDHCSVQDACITHQEILGGDIMHVLTLNPALMISFPLRYDTRTGSMIMLNRQLHSPFAKLYPFEASVDSENEPNVLIFDSRKGKASYLNTQTGDITHFMNSFADLSKGKENQGSPEPVQYLASNFKADRPYAFSYQRGSRNVSIIDFVGGKLSTLQVPFAIGSISNSFSGKSSYIVLPDLDQPPAAGLFHITSLPGESPTVSFDIFNGSQDVFNILSKSSGISKATDDSGVLNPAKDGIISHTFYSKLGNIGQNDFELFAVDRDPSLFRNKKLDTEVRKFLSGDQANIQVTDSVYLDSHSMQVSSLSSTRRHSIGAHRFFPMSSSSNIDGLLEIVHIPNHKNNTTATISHVPIQSTSHFKNTTVRLLPLTSQDVASVFSNGQVQVWEVVQGQIQQSLSAWKNRMNLGGPAGSDPMEMTISQLLKQKANERLNFKGPKHGKIDPNNAPHVGGNQWAGGSGGRDTAGLGGAGGPYRLDSGNPVTQVPDWVKDDVPEHIRKAAREIAQRTYAERLREIKLTKYDASIYEKFSNRVKREVAMLRNIIETLPSSKNERIWLKNQSDGDLDENKLIEGLTGEKTVYKRRVEPQSEEDRDPSEEKPRLLSLLVDVSGSMARFNSVDMRLEREAEAVLMVMESLANQGDRKRVVYDIYGHSGETYALEFCRTDSPPANAKERLELLESMQAHTMFCSPGDNTLEAISNAISRIKQSHVDSSAEKFIVLLSDANLSRYGIPASSLAKVMTPPDLPQDIRVFAIMIGSLGAQAQSLVESLPAGQGYVCLDTAKLPSILQQILTTTLLTQD